MKTIATGKGRITLLTLLAVWSISLVVDLPGLAISPMMSEIDTIFPHATHLEIQLLSVLPNFFILPFILLSGRLSMSRNKTALINAGMLIFLASGIACFFAKSLLALIVISCFIGIGCGVVIPLAAGVIADLFAGEPRMRQMGIKSGIANFSLIIATLVVGWIGGRNWHLPFVVYLLPVVPVLLSPFLGDRYLKRTATPSELQPVTPHAADPAQKKAAMTAAATATSTVEKIHESVKAHTAVPTTSPLNAVRASARKSRRCVAGIMLLYFTITFCTIVISYYVPFVMQDYGMPDSWTGIVTAIFFLFITLGGFFLTKVVRGLGNSTSWICLALMITGLVLIGVLHELWVIIIGVIMIGFGYGVMQPVFYTKGSLLAPTSAQATRTLSYIMTANYLGTAVAPLIFTGIKNAFHIQGSTFAFWLGAGFLVIPLILSLLMRSSYVFYTSIEDC